MAGESLKGFSKFFTNLTQAQRQEIDRAFADMQNAKEMTSLDESIRLLKRKPDQRLPVPQLNVTLTARGGIVEWAALPDQRINFYEADVSTFANFASFTTIPTYGLSVIIDGLTATKHVRVRGIRRDGTTTPFSDTVVVSPTLFDIASHTAEAFYIAIEGTGGQTILGGAGTDLAYTPINPDGNSMVWGFLTGYGDPAVAMFGAGKITASVFVKILDVQGNEVSDTEEVRVSFGEHFNSLNIGPFHIEHPLLGYTVQVRLVAKDLTVTQSGGVRAEDATEITWAHLNILEIGST
ncbi:hypothetical protein LCGC14_3034510 [marine sediment metagenome]|uniref:Uncharacterized protein n=1 Tax=marine sediment metagenome TaxID=412755 RepID=A0A0F8ZHI1_9ZZZZ